MRGPGSLFVALAALAGLGCTSYHGYAFAIGESRHGARPSSDVPILGAPPDYRHEAVGKVHSHCRRHVLFGAGGCTREEMERRLSEEGARLGAEAVYDVREVQLPVGLYTDIDLYGIAIRRDEEASRARP